MRETGYAWCISNPPDKKHTHAINSGMDVGIMTRALDGEWKQKSLSYCYLDFIDFLTLGKWRIE